MSRAEKIKSRTFTLHYSNISTEIVEEIFSNISASFQEVQYNLYPLTTENLEVYLLPVENIDYNFKVSFERKAEVFHFLKTFKDIKNLSLECTNGYSFGHSVFLDIPHELTHNALAEYIDQTVENNEYPRWFEEGLAELISIKGASNLKPCWADYRTSFTVPKISLARKEVSSVLFDWRQNDEVIANWLNSPDKDEKIAWNVLTLFGASYQLMKNSFTDDKGKKLSDFLTVIQKNKSKTKKRISNNELIKLYKNFLGNSFEHKYNTASFEETKLINDASNFVKQDSKEDFPNKNKIKRYKYLSILASSNKPIDLSCLEAIVYMRRKFEKESNRLFLENSYLRLIHTAIGIRLGDKEFLKHLRIIGWDQKPDDFDLKKIKEIINENLLRPICIEN